MSESKEIAVVEQPQQLITIEPAKYVALVFESFRKKFDVYKAEADKITVDATTTAGMKVAVEYRAKFRDEIRIASENARKERKAPILEIGRLLDGAAKEIAEEVAPYEARFDTAIKAEEKRKDDEKIAKAVAESARISAIRKRIAEMQAIPSMLVGKSSQAIAAAIESLEAVEIALDTYFEFAGEAQVAQADVISKLGLMLTAQLEVETEQSRIAAEREALARERAEIAERERVAAVARAEQEAKDRVERERVEAEQRAANERAAEALRQQQAAHEARMAAERAELQRQQDEINRQRAEQEQREREAREAVEAEQRAEAQRIADAQAVEAQRVQAEKDAAEAERVRRERVQFELNGPGESEIIRVLTEQFKVTPKVALGWIATFDLAYRDDMEKAA